MMKVYAVRDVKAESYGSPIFAPTKGLAVRSFVEACRDQRSELAKYPADFMLYEIGTYDPQTGALKGYDVPAFVCSATEAVSVPVSAEPVVPEVAS